MPPCHTLLLPLLLLAAIAIALPVRGASLATGHHAPAIPLIAQSPYVSVWAPTPTLTERETMHWTGTEQEIAVLVRIDGNVSRLVGPHPSSCPPLPQQSPATVNPTQTLAVFDGGGIEISLKFTTPALPDNLDAYAMPLTYVDVEAVGLDGKSHNVAVYVDITSQMCLGTELSRPLSTNQTDTPTLRVLQMGAETQAPLETKGDWTTITWGYAYLAAPHSALVSSAIGSVNASRSAFVSGGGDLVDGDLVGASVVLDLGAVSQAPRAAFVVLAYDEVAVMDFFGETLEPAWRAGGMTMATLLEKAAVDHDSIVDAAAQHDGALVKSLVSAGGEDYAYLCSLAYRQVTAACALASDGRMFMKEISSDGDVSTVDVIFPSAPFWLALPGGPELLWRMLLPVMEYAYNETSIKYNLEWAPHHLGTWPICDVRPDQQEQMPNEETANMLLMIAAIAKHRGSVDFARDYLPLLASWGGYLLETGLDPGDQLCSDDFMGPSTHNANLAVKSILGIGAYSLIAGLAGDIVQERAYMSIARLYAAKWMELDIADPSRDHYKLQYNLTAPSWSQKYNLLWQRVLGIDVFPLSVFDVELQYYPIVSNEYGPALDSRKTWAKVDWSSWIGALGNDAYHANVISNLTRFADQQIDAWPLGDLYDSVTGLPLIFRARPVVGALYGRYLIAQ